MFSILYLESLAIGIGLGMWSLVFAKTPDSQQPPPLPEKVNPYPIVAGIDFAEGPIFDKQGNLYFVNYIRNGTIGRRTPDGTVSVWCETGGQANGLKVDAEGYIIAADYGGKRILRIHPNGKDIQVLTDNYNGKPYLGTNDVCLDSAGNIYFSDPTGSSVEKPIGSIYRIDKGRKVTQLDSGLAFPNGLAVSPDQKKLFLAESSTNRLLVYDLLPDGRVSERRIAMQFPTPTLDGIMFDEYGRLWIARWTNKTVDVVNQDGKLLGSIPAGGDMVTNLCFWEKSLYVTVAGQHSIHRLDVGVGGLKY
jgi:gluconolactonase